MKPQRGYYSLIQFCPDASRMESVNVGVLLFCPALDFLGARTSNNNSRAEKLVGRGRLEKAALNAAKEAIERRLEVDRESFRNIEDIERFVNTRGNWLKLTQARPVKVFNPESDLTALYEELVGGESVRQPGVEKEKLFPTLHSAFEKLHSDGKAKLDLRVKVPVLDRSLNVPYAYQNGRLNLVIPQRFSPRGSASIPSPATQLALEGDLVQRRGINQGQKTRLIVVSSFDDENNTDFMARINDLFSEYHIKNVVQDQVAEFVAEVKREAH